MQSGDAIIVAELSRLGRSMLECMEILALATRKGIRVYSVKGSWQLDDSIQSKIIALAFSMAAEIERDLISQRSATLQKRTRSHARSAQRAGQKQTGFFPSGNRESVGERHDAEVYR